MSPGTVHGSSVYSLGAFTAISSLGQVSLSSLPSFLLGGGGGGFLALL